MYRYTSEPHEDGNVGKAVDIEVCAKDDTCPDQNLHSPRDIPFSRSWIDREYSHESSNPKVSPTYKSGERMITSYVNTGSKRRQAGRRRWHRIPSELGGYVCRGLETEAVEPCRDQGYYSRGTPVTIGVFVEYPLTLRQLPHNPEITLPRGGANTSDHVDILGSNALNEIILKVATGAGEEIRDNYVSRIREYAKRIRWDG